MNAPSAQPSPTRPSSSTFSRRPPRPGRHRPGAPPRAAGDHRPPRGERRPALQSTAIRRRHCPGSRSVVQLVIATADPRSDRSTRPNEAECTPNGMARCLLSPPALKANNRRPYTLCAECVPPVCGYQLQTTPLFVGFPLSIFWPDSSTTFPFRFHWSVGAPRVNQTPQLPTQP
jgi:hypothetical protein